MATEKDYEYLIQKLLRMPAQFDEMCAQKKWPQAKYIYDSALRVTAFLEVPDEIKKKLFGYTREEEENIEPLFDPKYVSKAYEQCVIKLYQGYENESYRRYGEPPQYYPYPRYPVPGYEKEDKKRTV